MENSKIARARKWRFTFSLRFFLLVITAIAIFLAWWLKPYKVDEPWGPTNLRMQYTLRRTWNGARVHVGPARLVYPNGHLAAEAVVGGLDTNLVVDWWIGDTRYEYWGTDGTPLSWEQWFTFLGQHYLATPNEANERTSGDFK